MTTVLEDFEQKVRQTASKFPSDVIKIRHSISNDWDGDPAIFFRILLSDDASRGENLADITGRIEGELFDGLRLADSEYIPYFYFRSKTEQDGLKDPEWE